MQDEFEIYQLLGLEAGEPGEIAPPPALRARVLCAAQAWAQRDDGARHGSADTFTASNAGEPSEQLFD